MADEVKPPVAIRITRPFATEDEFLEREFDTMTRTSVVLLGAQPRPQGVILRFEIVLTNGQSVLRGEGRVVAFKPIAHGNEPGLTLRFTRLDSKSKELVDRAAALREARIRLSGMPEARKSGQMPAVQVPRPPPPFTQPIVSSPFSAPTSAASMPTASSAGAPEATIAQRQPSSRPPPLPPQLPNAPASTPERRRTVPPPLPPSAFANAPRPQPPLPARFAELDIESTHVESLPSSSLDSEPPADPSPASSRPPRTEARVSSQPPSSEEPFKLSQPRISSLPPAPVRPSYAPAAGTPPPPIVEPFPLDPDAARARESGIPSPFVPPPVFVPPPSAPLPYVPSAYDIVREGEPPRDPLELEPLPFAPISDPSLSERISVDSMDAEPPGLLTFQDEPITSVEPEPPPAAPPVPPARAVAPVAEGARVSNGHAAHASASRGAASVARPADRDALLARLRDRARALPAERITAILAKRDDARAPRR